MKTIILCSLLLMGIPSVYSQTKKEKRNQEKTEAYNELKQLIESKQYEFTADRVYPVRGSSMDLTTNPGFVQVADSLAESHLPFFGRAYRVEYGGSGGINFAGKMRDYTMGENLKKQRITVSFRVKTANDVFDCYLSAVSKGSANLTVVSQNRESISYSGVLANFTSGK